MSNKRQSAHFQSAPIIVSLSFDHSLLLELPLSSRYLVVWIHRKKHFFSIYLLFVAYFHVRSRANKIQWPKEVSKISRRLHLHRHCHRHRRGCYKFPLMLAIHKQIIINNNLFNIIINESINNSAHCSRYLKR